MAEIGSPTTKTFIMTMTDEQLKNTPPGFDQFWQEPNNSNRAPNNGDQGISDDMDDMHDEPTHDSAIGIANNVGNDIA